MNDFSLQISSWYRRNKRDLPWRMTTNPYQIWLSEVILQQTRVDQGLSYYLKFTTNYPTITDLANADEQAVLNDWQGLGYYSRARNLHETAKQIRDDYNGVFPNTYENLLSLKGIGPYTAAAIASFSFNLPHAVLDGNVFRVLARYFDIDLAINSTLGKKTFAELASSLLDVQNPALHNQAIMEFGALQCKPVNPDCPNCPLQASCQSYGNKTVAIRPVKERKAKVKNRYFNYFLLIFEDQIALQKRTQKDIWQHLHEFVLFETDQLLTLDEIQEKARQLDAQIQSIIPSKKHLLSHQHIHAQFILCKSTMKTKDLEWIPLSRIQDYPLPRLIDRFLEENYPQFIQ